MHKMTKRRGSELVCPQKSCGHSESVAAPEEAAASAAT
jgi:hypothetical protein